MGKVIYYLIIILFFAAGIAIVIVGIYPNNSVYTATAENYLGKQLSKETPENQQLWGMADFKIFGRQFLFNQNVPTESTISKTEKDVTIPVWVSGHTLNGDSEKWIRKIHITVKFENRKYTIERISLEGGKTLLTISHQAAIWIFWSLLGPTVILFFLFLWGAEKSISVFSAWQILVSFLAVPLAGYLAYVFLGAGWAIWIGILVYLLLGYLYLQLFKFLVGGLLRFLAALS
jgi:hypothetical protein